MTSDTPTLDHLNADMEDRNRGAGHYLKSYPTTLRPTQGVEYVATFARLDRGPENEYGTPFIAIFTDLAGDDAPESETGEWGLWLIHTTALSGLKELRPAAGERVAFRYDGKRDSKTRKDRNGEPVSYHAYTFGCPDRPVEQKAAATWDSIDTAIEAAPF